MYGFYIDSSIHQIGFITELLQKLNGTLYTDSQISQSIFAEDFPSIRIKFHDTTRSIIESMKKDGIKILVLQDFHYKLFKPLKEAKVKFVQIFHGTSDKSYNLNRENIHYDLVCVAGRQMFEDFNRKGLNKNNNCVITGNLKTDRVFNNFYNRNREIENLGLDPAKKNALYAPTWMDGMGNSSFKKFGVLMPLYFPSEYQLTIKLHPNLFNYQGSLVDRLRKNIEKNKNIVLLENSKKIYDIIPIMAASDLLMTDVSGVTYEFIAFQRPMIFLDNKSPVRFFYGKKRKRIWKTGDVISNINMLPDVVRTNLQKPQRYQEIQKNMVDEIFSFTDGNTVNRIIEAIDSRL
jgi:CDP-glycerol glycerophosphotransferase (TagB/SpsB family)